MRHTDHGISARVTGDGGRHTLRIRLSLTLDVTHGHGTSEQAGERDSQLDALVERADPHPAPERPIGFRRSDDDGHG